MKGMCGFLEESQKNHFCSKTALVKQIVENNGINCISPSSIKTLVLVFTVNYNDNNNKALPVATHYHHSLYNLFTIMRLNRYKLTFKSDEMHFYIFFFFFSVSLPLVRPSLRLPRCPIQIDREASLTPSAFPITQQYKRPNNNWRGAWVHRKRK